MKKITKKYLLVTSVLFMNFCIYAGGSESEPHTPRMYKSPRRSVRGPRRTLSREQLLFRPDSEQLDESERSIDGTYYSATPTTSSQSGSHLCTELTKKALVTAVPFSATILSATLLGPYSGPASSAALLTGLSLSREIEINKNRSCLKSLQFTFPALIIAAFGAFLDYYLIRFVDPFMPKKIIFNTNIWQICIFFLLFQINNSFKKNPILSLPKAENPDSERRYNAPRNLISFGTDVYKVLCVRLAKLLNKGYNSQSDIHPELYFDELLKEAIAIFSQDQLMKTLMRSVTEPKDNGAGAAALADIPPSQHEQEEQQRIANQMIKILTQAIAKLNGDKNIDGGGGGAYSKSNTKKLGAAAIGTEELTADDLRAFGVEPPMGPLTRPAPLKPTSLSYVKEEKTGSLTSAQHNSVPGSAQASVATLSGLPLVISRSDSSGDSLPESKDKGAAMRLPGEVFSPSPNPNK